MTRFLAGDCVESMRSLPAESAHCCVTSPPYWGLRDYGVAGQLGLEKTPEDYVARMVEVFREVWRVLRDDGTLWLNIGDSYATQGGRGEARMVELGKPSDRFITPPAARGAASGTKIGDGLKPKDLCMIPARLALALQADGWYLRQEIIWAKGVSFCDAYSGSCMPESCRDRPTSSHEKLYLMAKSPRYYYDAEAVRERGATPAGTLFAKGSEERAAESGVNARPAEYAVSSGTRNLRSVWVINPQPLAEAHFATFPEALVRPCIMAGTSERGVCPECGAPWERVVERSPMEIKRSDRSAHTGNRQDASGTMTKPPESRTTGWRPTCEHDAKPISATVLDPFGGAGTTGLVAAKLGRAAILCELNRDYIEIARRRIDAATVQGRLL